MRHTDTVHVLTRIRRAHLFIGLTFEPLAYIIGFYAKARPFT